MKIAYLINSTFNSGGMERVLFNKCNYFAKLGYDITIITVNQKNRPHYFNLSPKVKCIDLDINFTDTIKNNILVRLVKFFNKDSKYKKSLSELLLKENFDIVVSMYGPELYWLYKINDGSKKVVEIHFSKEFRRLSARKGLYGVVDRIRSVRDSRVICKYDKFIVLTNEDKIKWGDKYKNIDVIYNSTSFYPATAASLESKEVIAIGRLSYQKGYDRMIKVWELVNKKHPDWKLKIYGDGQDKEKITELISEYNLNNAVLLMKPVLNIEEKLLGSSLLLVTSYYEGFCMALVEAMSCGVPTISFACQCGPRDVIDNGVTGFCVEDGEIEQLADKICLLIENRELRLSQGKASKERVKLLFSEDVIMNKWIALFNNLLDS